MNKNKIYLIILFLCCFIVIFPFPCEIVKADSLQENLQEQIGKIDFNEYENFFNSLVKNNNIDFISCLNNLLQGNYNLEYSSVFQYLLNATLSNVFEILPTMISIIAIAVLCGLIQQVRTSFLTEGVAEITYIVCIMGIFLLLSSEIIAIIQNSKKAIDLVAKLTQIMSPIVMTLMVSVGANVSASVYTPTVAFLSNGVIGVINNFILPLVGVVTVINVISNFSNGIKLNELSKLFSSIIKWLFGIIATVYGLFLSVQGIASGIFDGVSIKTAKYAISNSIPIVGGFLKDGFDLMVAGGVIIKNSIGIISIILMVVIVISPIVYLAVFSLLLNMVSAIIEPISDVRISNFCSSLSKSIEYVIACILLVGFMFFITVLLIILSANSFV